jgi:hypothetical protein
MNRAVINQRDSCREGNDFQIPPTAVGGWFIHSLQGAHGQSTNTTDRSRWMVHTQPTKGARSINEYHRPQSVGDSYLAYPLNVQPSAVEYEQSTDCGR